MLYRTMMNNRAILGLPPTAGAAEIKLAWRRLANKYHPDRAGGNTGEFQKVQGAYMALEKTGFAPEYAQRTSPPPRQSQKQQWNKPEDPADSWRSKQEEPEEDIFEAFKNANTRGPRYPGADPMQRQGNEIVANVSMRDAFAGFNVQVSRRRTNGMIDHVYVNIPAGTPNGHRGRYTLSDGTTETIITKMETNKFNIRGMADSTDLFSAGMLIGDIEIEQNVDAIDLITGCWIKVYDFLGEELTVRIPAGFNPLQRLKVANKGYVGWINETKQPTKQRMDMYIRLRPVFNKPSDIDRQKIINLYNTLGETNESN